MKREHWIGIGDELGRSAAELTRRELRDLITEGVYRGVLKAVAVYLLIGFVVSLVLALLR